MALLRAGLKETLWAAVGAVLLLAALELFLDRTDGMHCTFPWGVRAESQRIGKRVYTGALWDPIEFRNVVVLNEAGYHAPSYERRPGDQFRIAVIGDSFIEALQVPVDCGMVQVADRLLPGVQLLALGRSAQYLPLQLAFIRQEFDALLGSTGRYPPVDAVIFCADYNTLRLVASGERDYGISRPDMPWQYWLKAPLSQRLEKPARDSMLSHWYTKSLIACKTQQWLVADRLRPLRKAVDRKRLEWARDVLAREVIHPLAEEMRARKLPVLFGFIAREWDLSASPEEPTIRLSRQAVEAAGVPVFDTRLLLPRRNGLFYVYDSHPTPAGHEEFGRVLAQIIEEKLLPRLQEVKDGQRRQ